MSISDKIKADHQVKSKKLRRLKKKLKNRIPISKLQEMLKHEKRYNVNPSDFTGWSDFDDEGYTIACAKKEAKIELLEQIIKDFRKN